MAFSLHRLARRADALRLRLRERVLVRSLITPASNSATAALMAITNFPDGLVVPGAGPNLGIDFRRSRVERGGGGRNGCALVFRACRSGQRHFLVRGASLDGCCRFTQQGVRRL